MRSWALLAASALVACGGGVDSRTLDLEVRGLSARASALVLKVFPSGGATGCGGIDLRNVAGLSATIEQRWDRASGAPRTFELPQVEGEGVTIAAFSTDAAGAPMQLGCAELTHHDVVALPEQRLVITLSRRL